MGIRRSELESRVLDAIPARLLSVDSTASLQDEINKQLMAARKAGERNREKLEANLLEVSRKQDVIATQITERISSPRSRRSISCSMTFRRSATNWKRASKGS